MMQYIGRRYVPCINHQYHRIGALWGRRYKKSLVQDEIYLLARMRYLELNPASANMVKTVFDYLWPSFQNNALRKNNIFNLFLPKFTDSFNNNR